MKWEAGDVMLVENGCVHQHFNDDENEDPAFCWCSRRSRCFCSCTCLFQKMVEWPTDKLPPGVKDFNPPTEI